MTEEERDAIIDRLPADYVIWADDEELESFPWNLRKWLDEFGHPKAHPGCCAACGCATTCLAEAFADALVSSVLRELDRIDALSKAPSPVVHENRPLTAGADSGAGVHAPTVGPCGP